ncbi:MAG: isoprenylcysteine carboxylmethyltransferase family protein [Caulobacteraceae bacterium]|nr:isoprenylcysteine carboxylmethyltransferase family protein [Caulobacteraceae bacterium]
MARFLALAYGLVCYLLFFAVFLYAVGFVGGVLVPKGVDDGKTGGLATSLTVDLILLGIFAVQHSVMARPAFKAAWTRIVPAPIERSTYVLFSSLALALLYWLWRPLAAPVIWQAQSPGLADLLWGLFALGWLIVLISTFLISHFELFGLSQVFAFARSTRLPESEFRTPLFYRFVRHPIYLGFTLAFWATPKMTLGHLVFALSTTAYMLIAIQLEERDLVAVFGERYRRYRMSVSMIIPWVPGRGG